MRVSFRDLPQLTMLHRTSHRGSEIHLANELHGGAYDTSSEWRWPIYTTTPCRGFLQSSLFSGKTE